MSPFLSKLVMAVVILAAAWLGAWVPLRHRGGAWGGRFMSWGNAFAAGTFLGTGLLHMLAEAHADWVGLGWSYPMAMLLAGAGFMALLLFEHVLIPQPAHAVAHAHAGEPLERGSADRLASGLPAYTLLLGLSVHSVIAGLALGAEGRLAGVLATFTAIVAHKSTEAFALGLSLARSECPPRRARVLVFVFTLATPAGILLGASLSGLLGGTGAAYFDATFLAVAAGTFLYIASVDILQDEFLRAGDRLAKWLFAAAALAFTALLTVWL